MGTVAVDDRASVGVVALATLIPASVKEKEKTVTKCSEQHFHLTTTACLSISKVASSLLGRQKRVRFLVYNSFN